MTVLTDSTIKMLVEDADLLVPFNRKQVHYHDGNRVPSSGLSSCGYDVTLQPIWKRPIATNKAFVVGESSAEDYFETVESESFTLGAGEFVLATTKEYFRMPTGIMGSLFCKSTLARLGINLPPTIIEPGWQGNLVVEIYNMSAFPITLNANHGIGQVVFFALDGKPDKAYDTERKYYAQTGVQLAL